MAGQTEVERLRLVHVSMTDHEGFTHMLFVDAIVGLGFPSIAAGIAATDQGLASFVGNQHKEDWAWHRSSLESLPLSTLQDLYTALKTYEVTHAD